MIRCNNVQEQARDLCDAIAARWRQALDAGAFILGDEVSRFESWMSRRCGGASAIAVNSGTDALQIALRAIGIGAGDEVITCANSFIATVGAIVAVGAQPVLADVGEDELISASTVAPLLGVRTRAVIPVHLRGRPVEMATQRLFRCIPSKRSAHWVMAACWSPPTPRLPTMRNTRAITACTRVTKRSCSAATRASTRCRRRCSTSRPNTWMLGWLGAGLLPGSTTKRLPLQPPARISAPDERGTLSTTMSFDPATVTDCKSTLLRMASRQQFTTQSRFIGNGPGSATSQASRCRILSDLPVKSSPSPATTTFRTQTSSRSRQRSGASVADLQMSADLHAYVAVKLSSPQKLATKKTRRQKARVA